MNYKLKQIGKYWYVFEGSYSSGFKTKAQALNYINQGNIS